MSEMDVKKINVSINAKVGGKEAISGNYTEATSENLKACQGLNKSANEAYENSMQEFRGENPEVAQHTANIEGKRDLIGTLDGIKQGLEEEINTNNDLIASLDASIPGLESALNEAQNAIDSLNKDDFPNEQSYEAQKTSLEGIRNAKKMEFDNAKKDREKLFKETQEKEIQLGEKDKEIRACEDAIDEEIKKIETINKEAADEMRELEVSLRNANAQIASGASDIQKGIDEAEKEQENDTGFDYKDVKGNVLTSEQLDKIGIDNDKLSDINKWLKDEKGLTSRIDQYDGLDANEMNLIMAYNKEGSFGENDKYSAKEIESVLTSLGVNKDNYNNGVSVNDKSFVIGDTDGSLGLQKLENGDTKTWLTNVENGKMTSSQGIITGAGGRMLEKTDNKYTYTEKNGIEFVNKESTIDDGSVRAGLFKKTGGVKKINTSGIYTGNEESTSNASSIKGREDAPQEVSKFMEKEKVAFDKAGRSDVSDEVMAGYISKFYEMFKCGDAIENYTTNTEIINIVQKDSFYSRGGTTLGALKDIYEIDPSFVEGNFPEVLDYITPQ